MIRLTKQLPFDKRELLLLSLAIFTICWSIKSHNIALGLCLAYGLYNFKWTDFAVSKLTLQVFPILIILQFSVQILGLFQTSNLEVGVQDLERCVYPLVLFPVFLFIKREEVSKQSLLFVFAVSCLMLVLYGFVQLFFEGTNSLSRIFSDPGIIKEYVWIQPLYLSVYFIFAFFLSLEMLREQRRDLSIWGIFGLIALIVVSVAIIFTLRSKIALLLLPILMIIYLVIILKRRGWLVAFVLLTFSLLTSLLDKGGLPVQLNDYSNDVSHAIDKRLYIWKGTLMGIKEAPFFGAGTGGAQELLNHGYSKIQFHEGIDKEFNAHNQYLQFMARNGLIELLCFLAILGYSFWKSTKQSNHTFLMFNILVSLVMLTESFLSVQKGIAFFYFFLFTFIYLPEKKQEETQI